MKALFYALVLCFVFGQAVAHEMVPTYPKWRLGVYPGVLVTTIELFNKRQDVEFYEIGVFDENWEPVYFVADYKVIKLKYLSGASIDVYIAKENRDRVEYICSKSKIRKDQAVSPSVSSKICSRLK